MRILLSLFLALVIASGCSSKKKQAELLELSKPQWLKEQPVSSSYFYGIGITPKVGGSMFYEEKAKERALADMAKQISTKIKSESSMYRAEDNQGVYEYIQSRVKATSNEFLEGYEYVDKWEDLSNYYSFYRLSKSKFYALKKQRKQDAMQLSMLKYKQANEVEENMDWINAIELYAAAIDAISGYLNEETSMDTDNGKADLYEQSKQGINNLLGRMELSLSPSQIAVAANQAIPQNQVAIRAVSKAGTSLKDVPVKFNFSGGFLVNDKQKSGDQGQLTLPEFKTNKNANLKACIDLVALSRNVTKNLIVRQLIKKQKPAEVVLEVKVR